MLHYPKIPGSQNAPTGRCIAFEKYDGTNLHWDWDRDFGWHAFGTRRDAFNLTTDGIRQFCHRHSHLRQCVDIFHATLASGLTQIFCELPAYRDVQSCQAFTEFFGPSSFAGLHRENEPKELRLIDVQVDTVGMIGPVQFVADFGRLPIARVVYQGKLTRKFAEEVRTGKYNVGEGVICKGVTGIADFWMVKIKTYAYCERLQLAFADQWENYWE